VSNNPIKLPDQDGRIKTWVSEDADKLMRLRHSIESVFRGKAGTIELILTALLARGHVLLEDVPGTGKTTLARSLAMSLGGVFRRIQFTSDMLPSDVLGISVYREDIKDFELRKGPIFANVVLADEINRTSPRTQSALLEAMSEGQVTIDNDSHNLPPTFMVIATQNPKEFHGTYPLPESQLDRFMLRLDIGYPDADTERGIIQHYGYHDPVKDISHVADQDDVMNWQRRIEHVHVEAAVMDYLMAIVEATRSSDHLELGASTRAAIELYKAAQARAYLNGRHYITPDDVKALVTAVFCHRVFARTHYDSGAIQREQAVVILAELVESIPVPR
jgi:MoxR-like ATPase